MPRGVYDRSKMKNKAEKAPKAPKAEKIEKVAKATKAPKSLKVSKGLKSVEVELAGTTLAQVSGINMFEIETFTPVLLAIRSSTSDSSVTRLADATLQKIVERIDNHLFSKPQKEDEAVAEDTEAEEAPVAVQAVAQPVPTFAPTPSAAPVPFNPPTVQ